MASHMHRAMLACIAILTQAAAKKYNTHASAVAGKINVHMCPHSHDDVGYIKTPDQYFWGGNFSLQNAGVQYIIDSVIDSLRKNPDRKFIYVEQAFFDMWWRHAEESDQEALIQLAASGQLEFINGGWVMHDEASPTYVDMIDQTTLGVRNIKSRFGITPKVTWQIDPFGHSGVQSSLLTAAAGYLGLFLGRADYQDVARRTADNALEFTWASSPSQPTLAPYTDIMVNAYAPPNGGFLWDVTHNGGFQAIIDDTESTEYNVPYWVNLAVEDALAQANYTLTGQDGTVHIMWTMGQDFAYGAAQSYFSNLDRLIHYLNVDGRVNAFYSTPSIYAEGKLAQVATGAITLPVTSSCDMFPYASAPHSMWSGYFTSRPALKGYIRESSNYLQAARQAQAFAGGASADPDDPANYLFGVERGLATLQHHDGVTGTERQHVAYDYARSLALGRLKADVGIAAAYATLSGAGATFQTCDLANATICAVTQSGGGPTSVLLWNSRGQAVAGSHVRISVGMPDTVSSYMVAAANGSAVPAQLLPLSAQDTALRTQYYKADAAPLAWLAFFADLPAAGYAVYVVAPVPLAAHAPLTSVTHASTRTHTQQGKPGVRGGDISLSNGVVTLSFDAASGALTSWSAPSLGVQRPFPFTLGWAWYNASTGNGGGNDAAVSSAYIFRPNGTLPHTLPDGVNSTAFVTGPLVWEARTTVCSWISVVIRLWAGAGEAEVEWTVGPIPDGDHLGKEVIAKYSLPGMATNGTWITDSNGRDMYGRVRNARPNWNYSVDEPVAGNYYPVNTRIGATDAGTGLSVNIITDRTQAGASMEDGSLELMVHRRTLVPITGAMHEALNEPGLDFSGSGLVVRGVHTVRLDGTQAQGILAARRMMQDALFPPRHSFAALSIEDVPSAWLASLAASSYSGLAHPLPPNVHLLTVHSHGPTTLLLRLAHLYAVNEPAPMSNNATVSLASLFSGFSITAASETALLGNLPLQEVAQRYEDAGLGASTAARMFRGLRESPTAQDLTVTLGPLEIRTFVCTTTPQTGKNC